MKKLKRGYLITMEGGDGTGKSLTLKYLLKMLNRAQIPTLKTKEPNASNFVGKELREILVNPKNHLTKHEQAVIFALNRRWHINKIVKPALAKHQLVISDRFLGSSLAYQGNYQSVNGKVVDTNHIMDINQKIANIKTCQPDLNVYLWVDPEVEVHRIVSRKNNIAKFDHFDKALEHVNNIKHLQYQYHYALRDMDNPVLSINAHDVRGQSFKQTASQRAQKIFNRIKEIINK